MSVFSFFRHAAARGFEAGRHDCGLWLADYAMAQMDIPDPCPELRGLDDAAWRSTANQLPRVVARVCRRIGAVRIEAVDARSGDIGVIARHLTAPTGAIRDAVGWAQLTATGVVVAPLLPGDRVLAVWRLP